MHINMSMMTRTSFQAFLALTGFTLITAMPYFNTAGDTKKFADTDHSLSRHAPSDTSAEIDLYQQGDSTGSAPSLPADVIYRLILENLSKLNNLEKVDGDTVSSRGKRFGFGHPYVRVVTEKERRPYGRVLSDMLTDKRQEFGNYFVNGDRDLYENQVSPDVSKRRGFTALRGR